jgi:hypothetical protein
MCPAGIPLRGSSPRSVTEHGNPGKKKQRAFGQVVPVLGEPLEEVLTREVHLDVGDPGGH